MDEVHNIGGAKWKQLERYLLSFRQLSVKHLSDANKIKENTERASKDHADARESACFCEGKIDMATKTLDHIARLNK